MGSKLDKIAQVIDLFFYGITEKEKRTPEQIREHYEVEKKLANKLRNASREERRHLYGALYDELFRQVTHHPQLTQKKEPNRRLVSASKEMRLLKPFLNLDSQFLEVGPGDCSLSLEVAKLVRKVYAIDASFEITKAKLFPQNFELIISNGCDIPVPKDSVNIAYSKDLMEHLHPDDAFDHLRNIYKALTYGGKYVCSTPNRISGPHDISKYFDNVATGFHLKEYVVTELSELFVKAGFSHIGIYIGGQGIYVKFMVFPIKVCEKLLGILPFCLRRRISNMLPFKSILGITMIGTKNLNICRSSISSVS